MTMRDEVCSYSILGNVFHKLALSMLTSVRELTIAAALLVPCRHSLILRFSIAMCFFAHCDVSD